MSAPERIAQNFWHMTRNVIAREKALYEGDAVAAVAATSKAIADEARSLIAVIKRCCRMLSISMRR